MYPIIRQILSLAFLLIFLLPVQAQETQDTSMYKVEMQDGNVFVGTIVERSTNEIRLETRNLGIITIPVREVKKMEQVNPAEMKDGELWESSPLGARYFYGPNGYGLKQGEAYYQNIWVMFNQVSYGITDYFTMGIGTVPLFLFGGAPTPVWVTPKFSIPIVKDKFHLGAGALVGAIFFDDLELFGIVYGVGTVGPRDRNISLGVGYGYTMDGFGSSPAISLSGQYRVSKRTYLVSENYIFTSEFGGFGLVSIGGRTSWDKISLDYALVIPVGDLFIAIPFLGVGIPFGK